MIEILRETNIDFMGKKYYAFVFSGLIFILGIFAIVQIARGTANLGIDFTGGTAVQIKFEKPIVLSEVRKALEQGGVRDFELQDMPVEKKVLIKVKKIEEELGGFSEKIVTALSQKFPDQKLVIDSVTEVGPKVGERLRRDALWAIMAATSGLLIYIAWRFQFRFGIGATIAVLHDVFAVTGFFYIMNREINLVIISALLAIAGYSLTDTVVVFDRIRENFKIRLRDPVSTVVNKSINEVLSRTVITTSTTLLAALSLFLFGGEVIHDFALAIIIGILVGTYSSIFVASPIILLWGGKRPFAKK
ncbi:MAG: protein translocase subunit SecF [Nitrospirae bacterium]|jgi:preprotein translocase subunit SecF|nr:protein translocase subunit SecF [Nitrospirota bacterium]